METALLYPDGRTRAVSPLLGSVVPALLPRLSREELALIGTLRGPVSSTVLPPGAPGDMLVRQIRVRRSLLHYYMDQFPALDCEERAGVDAVCDIATVLHLEPWAEPAVLSHTLRPLRQMVGAEDELGFGPEYSRVLDVLGGIIKTTSALDRTEAVRRAWLAHPLRHWDSLADQLLAAATMTHRQVSLRMVHRVTGVTSDAVRRSAVFRAARLRAAAIILADVVDEAVVDAASAPWDAGRNAGREAA
jgi:hypothetical protein